MTDSATRAVRPSRAASPSVATTVTRIVALPVVLALLAVGVLLYPVVITQLKNAEQQRLAQHYSADVVDSAPEQLQQKFDAALEYNRTSSRGPLVDPWLHTGPAMDAEYQHYLSQLDSYEVMARLIVPAINVDLPVYHGTGEDSLQRGVGHLYGTDLPVGGPGTHSVLTGHSGLRNATMFDNLPKLQVGDAIYIGVSGQQLKYVITATQEVLPHETQSLATVDGQDLLTLITCTPYGINTHRLLVHAERTELDPQEAAVFSDDSALNWQWWMWALIAASAALLAGMCWWVWRQVHHENSRRAGLVDA